MLESLQCIDTPWEEIPKDPPSISEGNTYAVRIWLSVTPWPSIFPAYSIYKLKIRISNGPSNCWHLEATFAGAFLFSGENERMSIKRAWLRVISPHLYGADIIPYHFLKETEDTALIIPHLACFKVYLEVMTSWWINAVMSASTEHRACLYYALWRFVSLSCGVCLCNIDINGVEVSSWYKSHLSVIRSTRTHFSSPDAHLQKQFILAMIMREYDRHAHKQTSSLVKVSI